LTPLLAAQRSEQNRTLWQDDHRAIIQKDEVLTALDYPPTEAMVGRPMCPYMECNPKRNLARRDFKRERRLRFSWAPSFLFARKTSVCSYPQIYMEKKDWQENLGRSLDSFKVQPPGGLQNISRQSFG